MAEMAPPLTSDDLEQDLLNLEFAAYWYIGNETDRGWKFARTAFALIPRLRIFLIKDRGLIDKWVGTQTQNPAGVVFGWGDQVHRFLTESEADDLQTVLDAIAAAMRT